jgi:predicted amidophosphoribosyltransferase
MRCPQCGQENPTAARFCNDCGARLEDRVRGVWAGPPGEPLLAARPTVSLMAPT